MKQAVLRVTQLTTTQVGKSARGNSLNHGSLIQLRSAQPSATLQIEGIILQRGNRAKRNQGTEVWLGVLETVYGIHITTANVIDSNVTHVFLQQSKRSPRVNRQRQSQSQGELTHNTLKHLKRSSCTKTL